MRIYNGTNSVMSLPLMGNERITISPKTPSGHILCSSGTVSLLITSYTTDEIALIVSGPFEISVCANVPAAVNYVVQSLEEAIERFNPKPEVKPELKSEPEVKPESKPEPKPEPNPELKPESNPELKPELKPVTGEGNKQFKKKTKGENN